MALTDEEILEAIASKTVLEISELITKMEEKFGVKETFHFELLNAYKYIYRAGEKAGAEKDIEKAKNYFQMAVELIKKHPVELRPEMEVFRKLEKEIAPYYVKD